MESRFIQEPDKLMLYFVIILWLSFSLLMVASVTNWFRYDISIEGLYVVAALIFLTIFVGISLYLVSKYAEARTFLYLGIVFISIAIVFVVHNRIYGEAFSVIKFNNIVVSQKQNINIYGEKASYYFELENPFSEDHREFLVVDTRAEKIKIQIPLYEDKVDTYVIPIRGDDWISLYGTNESNIFILETSHYLVKKTFEINLATQTSRELE